MRIKTTWAIALVAMAMSSCSQEDIDGEVKGNGTQKTMATIQLSQSVSTMAAPPTAKAPTAEEKAITDAKLYVFNGTKVLEKVVDLGTTGKQTFEITDGTKYFYAAVNFGTQYPTVALGDPMNDVLKKVITIATVADATTASKFWMTNTADVSALINAGVDQATAEAGTTPAHNYVKIGVGRAAAKVACDFIAADNDADQPTGRLTSVNYKVKNVLTKMYFQPYPVAPTAWSAPNYDAATVNEADYIDAGATFKAAGTSTTHCDAFFYATENKNKAPKQGNTTYLVIEGTFTPSVTLDADGKTPQAGVAGKDFWRVTNADGTTFANGYYRAEPTTVAAEAVAGAGAQVVEYTGGKSYYRMWIADNSQAELEDKYAMKRNHFYWVSITSVAGAGWNTEEDATPTEPTDPIEVETWMKGEIEILDWTVIDQSGGI